MRLPNYFNQKGIISPLIIISVIGIIIFLIIASTFDFKNKLFGRIYQKPSSEAAIVNLLSNPGCETDTSGWVGNNASITKITASNNVRLGVGAACKVTRTSGTNYAIQQSPGLANPQVGQQYTAIAWVKSNNAVGKPVKLRIKLEGGANPAKFIDSTGTLDSTYKQLTVSTTVDFADRTALKVLVRQESAVSGDIFFVDDLSLTSTSLASPTPSPSPKLSFVNPQNNQSVASLVPVKVTIPDNINIGSVQLQVDSGTSMTNLIEEPEDGNPGRIFSADLDTRTQADGAHTLTAKLVESDGTPSTNNINAVFDNTAPLINITAPANGSVLDGTFTVNTLVNDNNAMDKVEFYIFNNLLTSDNSSPFSADFASTNFPTTGQYPVTAKAYDKAQNTKSTSITVIVDTQDPVFVSHGLPRIVNKGYTINSYIVATDDYGIAKVELIDDSTRITLCSATSPTSSYFPDEYSCSFKVPDWGTLHIYRRLKISVTDKSGRKDLSYFSVEYYP